MILKLIFIDQNVSQILLLTKGQLKLLQLTVFALGVLHSEVEEYHEINNDD
jgi:hypothetical protein